MEDINMWWCPPFLSLSISVTNLIWCDSFVMKLTARTRNWNGGRSQNRRWTAVRSAITRNLYGDRLTGFRLIVAGGGDHTLDLRDHLSIRWNYPVAKKFGVFHIDQSLIVFIKQGLNLYSLTHWSYWRGRSDRKSIITTRCYRGNANRTDSQGAIRTTNY